MRQESQRQKSIIDSVFGVRPDSWRRIFVRSKPELQTADPHPEAHLTFNRAAQRVLDLFMHGIGYEFSTIDSDTSSHPRSRPGRYSQECWRPSGSGMATPGARCCRSEAVHNVPPARRRRNLRAKNLCAAQSPSILPFAGNSPARAHVPAAQNQIGQILTEQSLMMPFVLLVREFSL